MSKILFEARFVDAGNWKKIVDALKDFKEINLECDETGVFVKVMDECHVSLADLKLDASFFEFYSCEKKSTIGLNVETLTKMIRSAPNEKSITLRKTEESDRLRIESEDDVASGIRRAADVPLISLRSDTLDLPQTEYQVEVEIPTKLYHLIVKDLAAAGENVTISVTSQAMKFEADGDSGHLENTFQKGQGAFASTHWKYESSSGGSLTEQSFSLRFLSAFSKACPLSETLLLSMSTGSPLRLQFPLGEESYLAYYIAPTLE